MNRDAEIDVNANSKTNFEANSDLDRKLNWKKNDGLIPVIIQDYKTKEVLMLGYMNSESLELTRSTGKVTFYSRSRQSLWKKGETSGNSLSVVTIEPDCDSDTLLIRVNPTGPTCHRQTRSCFDQKTSATSEYSSSDSGAGAGTTNYSPEYYDETFAFLGTLETIIRQRLGSSENPSESPTQEGHQTSFVNENSYVHRLAEKGLDRIAQKVGEEAVETVIAAKNDDAEALTNEAADLVFHLLVLLNYKFIKFSNVIKELRKRRLK